MPEYGQDDQLTRSERALMTRAAQEALRQAQSTPFDAAGGLAEIERMHATALIELPPARTKPKPPGVGGRFGGRRNWLLSPIVAVLVAAIGMGAPIAYAVARQWVGGDSPGPEPSATPNGPTFFDPLREPGRFTESTGQNGSCKFETDRLHARANTRSTYQCQGPVDAFAGDQTVSFDLDLTSESSCAVVWFRYRGDRGYQLTACANAVELEKLNGVVLTSLGRTSSEALSPHQSHDVSIAVVSDHVAVTIDGQSILSADATDPALRSGRMQFGVTNTSATSTAEVSFANLDVRSGS